MPTHISYTQGSTIYVAYKTAYFSLFELGQAKLGDVVLIHGASGTVGTAAVQLARTAGVTIIGTAGSESGMDTIKAQGAQFALNHHSEGYLQQISQMKERAWSECCSGNGCQCQPQQGFRCCRC